jgi:hypothetical protein
VTTVGAWKAIGGDWSESAIWPTSIGNVSDVGGNLLRRLEATRTLWTPILRMNTNNPHPLFFGFYGHSIYHHGAGFRVPWSRADRDQIERDLPPPEPGESQLYQQRWEAAKERGVRRNKALSQQLFARIRPTNRHGYLTWTASIFSFRREATSGDLSLCFLGFRAKQHAAFGRPNARGDPEAGRLRSLSRTGVHRNHVLAVTRRSRPKRSRWRFEAD